MARGQKPCIIMTATYEEIAEARMKEIRRLRQVIRTLEDQKADIVRFVFQWIHNFDHDFIGKIWGDEQWLADHFKLKFKGLCNRHGGYGSANAVCSFFAELGADAREKFAQHILEQMGNRD